MKRHERRATPRHGVATFVLFALLTVVEHPSAAAADAHLQWQTLAPAPTPRTEAAAAVLDGEIYLMGGYVPPAVSVPLVEIYDPEADAWRPGPALPLPVNHAAAASTGDTIYVFGGYLGYAFGSQFSAVSAPTDQAFALRDGVWERIAPLPAPRAAGGAAAVDGKIYIIGGVGPGGGNAASTLVYDPQADRWRELPGLPFDRQHLGVASAAGAVYALGGRVDLLNSNLALADLLAPPRRRWRSIPPMPTARGGLGAAATANGFVVAVGGEGPGSTFEEAEAFSVRAGRWVSLPPMPTPRHGLGVVAIGNVVYALAGGTDPSYSYSNINEAIDLSALRAR